MQFLNSTRDERFNARRDQIIAACRICFRKHGFHGAGMAEIAKLSKLSVGQIYRYFVNKDAIIEEIVRRIVDGKIQRMTLDRYDFKQLAFHLSRRTRGEYFPNEQDVSSSSESLEQTEMDQALMQEVAAEATRNTVVAKILHDAEIKLFQQAKKILSVRYPQLSDVELTARIELIAVLSEGTSFRLVMQKRADPEILNNIYNQCFDAVFPPLNTSK
ncbi:TetR/AcrR family transcriptional regulator [Rouxiella sp. Mn2063]|uniref:TetR/AcrR family transcriptional regulator n=1 Tax=Rouxiella sp. Mn2063 TaxID=3395262 RepID=UPI003BCD9124